MVSDWDYDKYLKTLADSELRREYQKILRSLETNKKGNSNSAVYERRSRRKGEFHPRAPEFFCICNKPNDGGRYISCKSCGSCFHPKCVKYNGPSGEYTCDKCKRLNDDVYVPQESPAYDTMASANLQRKRKKTATKNAKRKRQNIDNFIDQAAPTLHKKTKKRKREPPDNLDGPRKVMRHSSATRRVQRQFEDEDSEEYATAMFYKRKGLRMEESDDDSVESDFGQEPESEFRALSMKEIMERIVKYEKKMQQIRMTKQFQEQLEAQSNESTTLITKNSHLETQVADLRTELNLKKFALENSEKKQKHLQQLLAQTSADSREKMEKLHQQYSAGFKSNELQQKCAEVDRLKARILELEKHCSELDTKLRNSGGKSEDKLQKQAVEYQKLKEQLWVEQKFSKELQTHYKGVVDLVTKNRSTDQGDVKLQEALEAKREALEGKRLLQAELEEQKRLVEEQQNEIVRLKTQHASNTSQSKTNHVKRKKTEKKAKTNVKKRKKEEPAKPIVPAPFQKQKTNGIPHPATIEQELNEVTYGNRRHFL